MLTVLAGVAEFEGDLIRNRSAEGLERARARGVLVGRKSTLTEHQRADIIARQKAGEVQCDIARSYNVCPSTISRVIKLARAK
jgi:DNA invertase Pin-like site-specific DNA recombinase